LEVAKRQTPNGDSAHIILANLTIRQIHYHQLYSGTHVIMAKITVPYKDLLHLRAKYSPLQFRSLFTRNTSRIERGELKGAVLSDTYTFEDIFAALASTKIEEANALVEID
jgi:hypothetical protein